MASENGSRHGKLLPACPNSGRTYSTSVGVVVEVRLQSCMTIGSAGVTLEVGILVLQVASDPPNADTHGASPLLRVAETY